MEQRVEGALKRIDAEATEIQRDLERNYIRDLQGRALRNGALCCDDKEASAESVQNCIKRTQQPLIKVQAIIKRELEDFQNRLQRCMMTCQDRAKDTMSQPGQTLTQQYVENQFADCMCECADEHLKLLPLVKERLLNKITES